MFPLIPNPFTSYSISSDDMIEGTTLSNTQKAVIQNQIATLAEQKLNLKIDPTNPLEHVQTEAYLRGQIDSLSYLLTASDEVVLSLNATDE